MAVHEFADEVAKSLGAVMPPGFSRKGRNWSRRSDGLASSLRVVRNEPYELGEALLIDARVTLESGRGVGFVFHDRMKPSDANWQLKLGAADDVAERQRIRGEIHQHVRDVSLPWIEERATPGAYVAHLRDFYQPYQRIEAFLAFGPDASLAAVLEEGPKMEVPTTLSDRRWGAISAEAALRGYETLGTPPSPEWREFARAVLTTYKGRPPNADRDCYVELAARLHAFSP